MSTKLNKLREQAQELIVSGNAKGVARGHGILAVLDVLEEEENFKLRITVRDVNNKLTITTKIANINMAEVLGMIELAKTDFLKSLNREESEQT